MGEVDPIEVAKVQEELKRLHGRLDDLETARFDPPKDGARKMRATDWLAPGVIVAVVIAVFLSLSGGISDNRTAIDDNRKIMMEFSESVGGLTAVTKQMGDQLGTMNTELASFRATVGDLSDSVDRLAAHHEAEKK